MSLRIVPVSFEDACEFIRMWHRTHQPHQGHKFSLGVATDDDLLVGVANVGRPNPRAYQDGLTLEVTRACTDGTRNANSMLYAAAWRATKALGYRRLITYTQHGEAGASLRAAGWQIIAQRPPRGSWDMPSRPRHEHGTAGIQRYLWEAA